MLHDITRTLYPAFGVHNGKLPMTGHSGVMFGQVFCWIVPKQDKAQDAARVWCACPNCGKAFTAGKLHQHIRPSGGRRTNQRGKGCI